MLDEYDRAKVAYRTTRKLFKQGRRFLALNIWSPASDAVMKDIIMQITQQYDEHIRQREAALSAATKEQAGE